MSAVPTTAATPPSALIRRGLAPCAALLAIALVPALERPARADRYEMTIWARPTRGKARIANEGTGERAHVYSRGFAAGASWGVRDWLDLGGELVAADFDEASYQVATLPVSRSLRTGPLR